MCFSLRHEVGFVLLRGSRQLMPKHSSRWWSGRTPAPQAEAVRIPEGYSAFCPELQGCYTQGATFEEAVENIRDAIRLHMEDRLEASEGIPQSEAVSLTSLEVAV